MHIPTPHKECDHYVVQMRINKKKMKKRWYERHFYFEVWKAFVEHSCSQKTLNDENVLQQQSKYIRLFLLFLP